jgi:tetratricopeptide (TPR) repeat protein
LHDYERALALFPDDALTYQHQGDAFYSLKRVDEALIAYEHASRLAPMNENLYAHRSFILSLLGRNEEALALINQAIQLKPASKFYREKCTILLALHRDEEVVEAGKEAIRRNLADSSLYSSVGLALFHLNSYRQSLAAFDQAIALQPNNSELQKIRE